MADAAKYVEKSLLPPELRSMVLHRELTREEVTLEMALVAPIELFRDEQDEPFIRLPESAGGGLWPLGSPRIRGWLAELCWQWSAELLKPAEADAVLRILDGKAWASRRLDAVQRDPIVCTIVAFLELQGQWIGSMSDLHARLKKLADSRRIAAAQTRWPGGPAAFSAQLRQRASVLAAAGIELEIRRTNRGSRVRLIKIRAAATVPPPPGAAPPRATPSDPTLSDLTLSDPTSDHPRPAAPAVPSLPAGNLAQAEPVFRRPRRSRIHRRQCRVSLGAAGAAPGLASRAASGDNHVS